jgi:chemotaxis family two-component system response regulator PixG
LPHLSSLQADLQKLSNQTIRTCWEYQLLSLWIDERKISREQATSIVRSSIVEVMFDITQAIDLRCQIKQDGLLSTRLAIFDADHIIAEADKLWQAWQQAKVADRSPNMAPVIRQPQQLQQRTSPKIYQNLSQLLNGKQSLRDLAVRMKRDVITVTKSLLPYLQLGLVQLVEVSDLASPVNQKLFNSPGTVNRSGSAQAPLIACVDDSPLTCQTMQKILTDAGYQFLGINDPLRAIATLLSRKPNLIFLDLVMPNTNGYEICSQLRKLSIFRQTPVIILTGNDGIIDRVRAKMVGSTDFISKPVEAEVVLATVEKHLEAKSQI